MITNIGVSHFEKLGSRQNILRAKLEVTKGMKDNGILILNGDDELLSGLNGLLNMPVVYYGINENIPLHAFGIETMGEEGVRFSVNIRNEDVEIVLSAPGIHQVSNALAAIACGIETVSYTHLHLANQFGFRRVISIQQSLINHFL